MMTVEKMVVDKRPIRRSRSRGTVPASGQVPHFVVTMGRKVWHSSMLAERFFDGAIGR